MKNMKINILDRNELIESIEKEDIKNEPILINNED